MDTFSRSTRPFLVNPEESLEKLRGVVAMRRELDLLEARHVDSALKAGRSWSQIAAALGVSKQAAHKRHARRNREARLTRIAHAAAPAEPERAHRATADPPPASASA